MDREKNLVFVLRRRMQSVKLERNLKVDVRKL